MKTYELDIITILNLITTNAEEETKPILRAAVAEIERLREIEALISDTGQATKEETWQKLLKLVQ